MSILAAHVSDIPECVFYRLKEGFRLSVSSKHRRVRSTPNYLLALWASALTKFDGKARPLFRATRRGSNLTEKGSKL